MPFVRRTRLQHEDDRTREQQHREEQVRHHDRPAEIALHREIPERRLRERPDEDRKRQANDPVWQPARAPRREPADEGQRDRDAADESVAELDVGVHVLGRQRVPFLAAGPVATAEPRVRETDRGAGTDDQP